MEKKTADILDFDKYCGQARKEFVSFFIQEDTTNALRTEVDSFLICFDQIRERLNKATAYLSTPLVEQWVKELQEIKKAVKWMWENLHLPHTSDHFNVPANCIQSIENLETSLSTGSTGEGWVRVEDRLPEPKRQVFIERKNGLYIGHRINKPLSKCQDIGNECYWYGVPINQLEYSFGAGEVFFRVTNHFNDQTVLRWSYVPLPTPPTT